MMLALGIAACSSPPSSEQLAGPARSSAALAASHVERAEGVAPAASPGSGRKLPGGDLVQAAVSAPQVAAGTAPSLPTRPVASEGSQHRRASKLEVKRFVVSTLVKDREPVSSGEPLPSDGAPIYAFAELANPTSESENVRVTFERKGSAERFGNVVLPVPGNVARHRTWASTRYIRAAGVWEAVLWSEAGQELSRTSFEVKES